MTQLLCIVDIETFFSSVSRNARTGDVRSTQKSIVFEQNEGMQFLSAFFDNNKKQVVPKLKYASLISENKGVSS